jgi:GTP diphosphokinase / guanosine-3',5'-bis(diphosphate) 3'-diphosphatase
MARALLAAWRRRDDAADAAVPLIAAHRRVFPGADAGLLRRAYRVADHWHAGQTRRSGTPYITHPLAVAILLAEIGMDTTTLVAALLHDTVEDTGLTIGQVKAEFGAEVAVLVDGVTKLDGSRWGDHAEGETFRKMILAASIDLRVLIIKLADRVHNLRTLAHHPKREKRERIARASMELLVPFAQRLGLYEYQREMEDLAFANLVPEAYERVRDFVRQTAAARETALAELMTGMRGELAAVGLRVTVEARSRHFFSINRDLPGGPAGWISGSRAGPGAPLRPLDATRVVVVVDGAEGDCYVALGVLHGHRQPIESRFRDYISMPKYNMYRSLHTAVQVGGELVGVLIRTPAMDAVATYGVAARIREAGGKDGRVSADVARQADLDWLNRLLAWQPLAGPGDFLDGLRADLSNGGIVVFTPDGTPVKLPDGSTAVDFAYAVSPATAGSSVGVLVNGMRKPMENPLAHGQVVDLIEGPYADPPESWLAAAHSGHARTHLKAAIARRKAEDAAALGRIEVEKASAERGVTLRDAEDDGTAFSACRRLGYPDLDVLYEAVGACTLAPEALLTELGVDRAQAGRCRLARGCWSGGRRRRLCRAAPYQRAPRRSRSGTRRAAGQSRSTARAAGRRSRARRMSTRVPRPARPAGG